jgi:hypothetical protein
MEDSYGLPLVSQLAEFCRFPSMFADIPPCYIQARYICDLWSLFAYPLGTLCSLEGYLRITGGDPPSLFGGGYACQVFCAQRFFKAIRAEIGGHIPHKATLG